MGKVPYASTYQVSFFKPWSHYEEFLGPVKNNAMPDVHTQIYPWKKFTIDALRNGQIPWWNPYNFAGNPHLANFQSAVLSPFNILFFILPFIDAWSILILLQPLLAGIFTYLLVRTYKVSKVGSLISSIAFMFCGFIVVWMAYGTLGYAILYLPLALFAIERYLISKRFWFLILLVLTIPLSFFSGHFQISFYFLISILIYILFKGTFSKNKLDTIHLIIAICFGLFLSLPQLLPSMNLYFYSVRSEIFQVGEAIPLQYFMTIISPDFFGNPVTRNDWFGHYAEWAGFIGIWPLILAIYGIIRVRLKTVMFFLLLGIVSIILSAQTPLSPFIISLKIPVLSTSALSRIIVIFSFSFAILSGFGFDALKKDIKDKNARKAIMLILAGVLLLFAISWILIFIGKIYPDKWLIVAKRNLILPTAFFIMGVFLLILSMKNKIFISFTVLFLLFIISFDSLRFAQKWMPFDPRKFVYPDVPVISAIKSNVQYGRVFGNLGTEVSSYYGIQTLDGYDPLYIGRYGEFIRSAGTGDFLSAERSVVKLARIGKYTDRVLDLLGVDIIFHAIADTNQGWAYPVWKDRNRFSLVYKDDRFQLFKNNYSLPRASLFYDYEVISDKKSIIKRFYDESFDFRKKLILEEKLSDSLTEGVGNSKITEYTPNRIKIEVKTNKEVLLFLTDNYYPGWKAKVNGKETKIYRADYTFRAILVPAGDSIVEFYYSGLL